MIPSYTRDCSVAVIVYDITSRTTFENTNRWIDDIRQVRGPDVVIMLVGNKTDLGPARAVPVEDGQAKAKELDVLFIETSAKANFNIETLFRKVAAALPGVEEEAPAPAPVVDVDLKAAPQQSTDASLCGAC